MILCDTNIIIEFLKGNSVIVEQLRVIGQTQIAVSAITQAELLFGARDRRELQSLQKMLLSVQVSPVTPAISDRFIQLIASYSLSHRLAIPDALIAATAIEYGMSLYTLNLKDFRFIAGLHLYTAVP
jgi:tRNA(fMet)-specific endonuclease VapC